ncbi:MAG: hypothetical protein AAGA92_02925 [Planctomycetota bacterium]
MNALKNELLSRLPWVPVATLVGGLGFIWVQLAFADWGNIADYIGGAIVEQGGYPERFASPIGWTLHLGISFSYVMLALTLTALPFLPAGRNARLAVYGVLSAVLGVATTAITGPAIATTISLLAGNVLPAELPGIAVANDLTLWNHVVFFAVAFGLVGAAPDCLRAGTPFEARDPFSSVTGMPAAQT